MRALVALATFACARPALLAPEKPPAYCNYDVRQNPTLGVNRRYGFGFFPAVSPQLETPLAAGGAHTEILALSAATVATVRSVSSSAPDVVGFNLASLGGSPCQNQALLRLQSGAPGAATLRLYDDGGGEIDHVQLTVEATTTLALDRQFATPPSILAGSLQGVHATTLGASGILVGTGAVEFHLEGDLMPFPILDAAPPWWGGDAVTFTGTAGSGSVVADCGGAHAEVAVQVVDPSSLGEVTITAAPAKWPAPVEIEVSGLVGGAPVYGAQCRWSWPFNPPEWLDGGWIGGEPEAHYRFTAAQAGTFNASCELPGGRTEVIALSFQ